MNKTRHEYKEVKTLLRLMREQGFAPTHFFDGGEDVKPTLGNIFSVNAGTLWGKNTAGVKVGFFLVYGNDTGELISDYTAKPEADSIANAWMDIYPL